MPDKTNLGFLISSIVHKKDTYTLKPSNTVSVLKVSNKQSLVPRGRNNSSHPTKTEDRSFPFFVRRRLSCSRDSGRNGAASVLPSHSARSTSINSFPGISFSLPPTLSPSTFLSRPRSLLFFYCFCCGENHRRGEKRKDEKVRRMLGSGRV